MAMGTQSVGPRGRESVESNTERKSEREVDPTAPPEYDYVAMVSRDRDGNPAHTGSKFKVLLPEDASDEDKSAAWNAADGEKPSDSNVETVPDWLRK